MARKLVLALVIAVAAGAAGGCKDDRPTPMNIDAKGMYSNQSQYKGAVSASATTTHSP
jgi:hypothetical protein